MPKDRDLGEHKRPPLDCSVCESSPEKKNLDRLMLSLLSLGPDFNLFWSQIFSQNCKEQSTELRQSRLCTFL